MHAHASRSLTVLYNYIIARGTLRGNDNLSIGTVEQNTILQCYLTHSQ